MAVPIWAPTRQPVGGAEVLVQAAEEGRRGDLGRLIDPHRQHVFLGDLELDPRAALGDDPRGVKRAVADRRDDAEVHARRAVQLAHDHALGAVHDELAAAHHDRHLPEVDLLLGNLRHALAHQTHADPERHAERQAQLAALVGRVPRLIELVVEVLQLHRAVVGLDRVYLPQQGLEALLRDPRIEGLFELEEALIGGLLDLCQRGHRNRVAALREVAHQIYSHSDTSRTGAHRVPPPGVPNPWIQCCEDVPSLAKWSIVARA
jgi:hypothetical protein